MDDLLDYLVWCVSVKIISIHVLAIGLRYLFEVGVVVQKKDTGTTYA